MAKRRQEPVKCACGHTAYAHREFLTSGQIKGCEGMAVKPSGIYKCDCQGMNLERAP